MVITYSEEIIDQKKSPLEVFEDILARIYERRNEFNIPIKTFSMAPARLKRLGVTFLVTLEQYGKELPVPFRVEHDKIMYTRFCTKEELASWRGNYIHPIKLNYRQTIECLMRKVIQYLRSSLHRLIRKIQKYAIRNGQKLEKRLMRSQPRNEPYRRVNRHQLCHH